MFPFDPLDLLGPFALVFMVAGTLYIVFCIIRQVSVKKDKYNPEESQNRIKSYGGGAYYFDYNHYAIGPALKDFLEKNTSLKVVSIFMALPVSTDNFFSRGENWGKGYWVVCEEK